MKPPILLLLLPLLCQGLENVEKETRSRRQNTENVETPICDQNLQQNYCEAWYGGDVHTGCKYCGIGKKLYVLLLVMSRSRTKDRIKTNRHITSDGQ